MKAWPLLLAALLLGGCLADAGHPNAAANADDDRPTHRDREKEKCFSTSVAGQPENVCY